MESTWVMAEQSHLVLFWDMHVNAGRLNQGPWSLILGHYCESDIYQWSCLLSGWVKHWGLFSSAKMYTSLLSTAYRRGNRREQSMDFDLFTPHAIGYTAAPSHRFYMVSEVLNYLAISPWADHFRQGECH